MRLSRLGHNAIDDELSADADHFNAEFGIDPRSVCRYRGRIELGRGRETGAIAERDLLPVRRGFGSSKGHEIVSE